MSDVDSLAQIAHLFDRLREPIFRAAIQALRFPSGSRGLDAGCGIGLQTLLLAEAVGSAGHVTGLDLSPEILVHARDMVKKAGLSKRITFREGDVRKLPFDDNTFDWAWSVDCIGYAPMEPLPLVKELARVVKPGGTVALLAWSSEKLLPGYPLLEARLSATSAGIAPFTRGKRPESHFLRALGWFRDAGLEENTTRTFAGDVQAPLIDDHRRALTALFEMRWPGVESELRQDEADGQDPADNKHPADSKHPWAEFQRLCLPESPDFILDHPDYYAFFTYSMFQGQVKEARG